MTVSHDGSIAAWWKQIITGDVNSLKTYKINYKSSLLWWNTWQRNMTRRTRQMVTQRMVARHTCWSVDSWGEGDSICLVVSFFCRRVNTCPGCWPYNALRRSSLRGMSSRRDERKSTSGTTSGSSATGSTLGVDEGVTVASAAKPWLASITVHTQ